MTCKNCKVKWKIYVELCPLHAAAPELLEALKMFVEEVREDNQDSSLMEAFIKARAAISKAEK